jgi:hypothetical protein
MRSTTRMGCSWTRRITYLGIGGLLCFGGYLTALWTSLPTVALTMSVQAAESHHESSQQAQHDHTTHAVDLAPFMIRNAYHFATLYHAARAARWELAAYQAEELEENLAQAAQAGGPYAQSLQDFLKEHIQPLRKTITSQNAEQFHAAFQAAVGGCNDCHKATQHGFIIIPQEPPALSIFVFPPAGK